MLVKAHTLGKTWEVSLSEEQAHAVFPKHLASSTVRNALRKKCRPRSVTVRLFHSAPGPAGPAAAAGAAQAQQQPQGPAAEQATPAPAAAAAGQAAAGEAQQTAPALYATLGNCRKSLTSWSLWFKRADSAALGLDASQGVQYLTLCHAGERKVWAALAAAPEPPPADPASDPQGQAPAPGTGGLVEAAGVHANSVGGGERGHQQAAGGAGGADAQQEGEAVGAAKAAEVAGDAGRGQSRAQREPGLSLNGALQQLAARQAQQPGLALAKLLPFMSGRLGAERQAAAAQAVAAQVAAAQAAARDGGGGGDPVGSEAEQLEEGLQLVLEDEALDLSPPAETPGPDLPRGAPTEGTAPASPAYGPLPASGTDDACVSSVPPASRGPLVEAGCPALTKRTVRKQRMGGGGEERGQLAGLPEQQPLPGGSVEEAEAELPADDGGGGFEPRAGAEGLEQRAPAAASGGGSSCAARQRTMGGPSEAPQQPQHQPPLQPEPRQQPHQEQRQMQPQPLTAQAPSLHSPPQLPQPPSAPSAVPAAAVAAGSTAKPVAAEAEAGAMAAASAVQAVQAEAAAVPGQPQAGQDPMADGDTDGSGPPTVTGPYGPGPSGDGGSGNGGLISGGSRTDSQGCGGTGPTPTAKEAAQTAPPPSGRGTEIGDGAQAPVQEPKSAGAKREAGPILPAPSLSAAHLQGCALSCDAVPPPALQPGELRLCGLTFHPELAPRVRSAMEAWEAGLAEQLAAEGMDGGLADAEPEERQVQILDPEALKRLETAGIDLLTTSSSLADLLGLSEYFDAPLPEHAPHLSSIVEPRRSLAPGPDEGRGGAGLFAAAALPQGAVLGVMRGYVLPKAAARRYNSRGFQALSDEAKAELGARAARAGARAAAGVEVPSRYAWQLLEGSFHLPMPGSPGWELSMLGYGSLPALINDPRREPRGWVEGNDVGDEAARTAANCAVVPVSVRGLTLPVLAALRDIQPGEQLLRDYGADWWTAFKGAWRMAEERGLSAPAVLHAEGALAALGRSVADREAAEGAGTR
ncbi:hypothetical protein HYH03_006438 [Edaphochlamys debaryana]|uniref:SET domain-containing protein n=1 Tax=Edaphochlamys debaryana TaxID=47281 RepID=A0A835Y5G5_9CHLO|nr:hypothetical protein HYH03_006438 [Edaphochlamys debaryana]|eukprot:KAG2495494.1 hypothetical protein HYH03_006438 [Edaphochlamys debaryana]